MRFIDKSWPELVSRANRTPFVKTCSPTFYWILIQLSFTFLYNTENNKCTFGFSKHELLDKWKDVKFSP